LKKIILALLCALTVKANAQITDTINNKPADTAISKLLKVKREYDDSKPGTYVVPAVLVGYGALSFVANPVRRVDYYFKDRAEHTSQGFNFKVGDYLQLAPAALVYGLNLAGVKGKHSFVDRTALLALSGVVLTIADGTKFLAKRTRPYGTDPLSFPSGHTGAAFLCAEYLAQEYSDKSPWYGVLGYTMATTTAVLRVYGKTHWFSDCVAGAGLGMLSAKAAYLLYPKIRKALSHKDKQGRSTSIMPTYEYGAPGVAFAMQL